MVLWPIWIVIAFAALVGELLTSGFFLASFGVAALVAAALSLLLPPFLQVVVFGVLSLLLLMLARPAVIRVLPLSGAGETSPRIAPTARLATAAETIDAKSGLIRVGTGEFWSARALQPGTVIRPGSDVEIVRMEGLIALVRPPSPPALDSGTELVPFGLSEREVEVLALVAQGLSNAEIAERLYLSPRTVHHHVSHIFNKMGVSGRVEAVRLALQHGLVSSGDAEE